MITTVVARVLSGLSLLALLVTGSLVDRLPAQLIPKAVTTTDPVTVPTRLAGAWEGTARESLGDNRQLEYAVAMTFAGDDAALKLDVQATAKVPTEDGQQVTVEIRASYLGAFKDSRLAMRSDRIDVRVVETNATVPSSPQQVEARLENGVLTGRIGTEQDGWTTFTARPKAGATNIDAPVVRLAGPWTGTAREPIGDNRTLEYAVAMNFSGDDAALRLDVQATAKVPTENGQQVTVEIRASYTGSMKDSRLAMRSERIDVRVVETNATVPSSPQQVEGRLENGVLTGRIGGEQDGWTSFTARPKADGGGGGAQPADQPAFTGRWRGTCRELGPDQKEITYPMTVEFSGSGADLRAAASADLRYPMQEGGTTAVEYRATFRGSASGAGLQLRSEKVEIRLPELQRNETGPAQELTGRIEQGVLKARIGNGTQGFSELELRPETGGR